MIEILLQAERALSMGMVDQAERLYRQALDADPRNSIAVVGLARIALEHDDGALAWREAKRALEIDPENAAARRLVDRLEEVWQHSGRPVPDAIPSAPGTDGSPNGAGAASERSAPASTPSVPTPSVPTPSVPTPSEPSAGPSPQPEPAPAAQHRTNESRPGLVDRLLRRNHR